MAQQHDEQKDNDTTLVSDRTETIPRNSQPERQRVSVQQIASTLVAIAALLIIAVVGYLIIRTLLDLRKPIDSVPAAVGTQVEQVLHPTPTIIADPQTIVLQVESLAQLQTAQYTIEKVITAESGQETFSFLFGDRILFVAVGKVTAGVDLSLMAESDVRVAGESVFVTVPASEIFITTLDNEASYIYDRQTGPFGLQDNLETEARREAERRILEAAIDDGILDLAQQNANSYLESLLKSLGFKEVVFVKATPGPGQNRGK